ncbi:MAG: DUF2877 domain-containing protein [Candidatus Hadarchaeum sp.]|uniref:DUF2877 domain-containing protein n=1 Tax=Candidatus Hadarchaeum sp. TaxID=2883567 RepID=UPI003D144E1E
MIVLIKKRRVKATVAGRFAFDILSAQSEGKVHSVFERTFNILFGTALVGVGRSDVVLSPMDLITDLSPAEKISELGIKKGMGVRVASSHMTIGDVLDIDLAGVMVWRPPNGIENPASPAQIKKSLSALKERARAWSGTEGLGQLLFYLEEILHMKRPATAAINVVSRAALPHIVDLVRATRQENIEGVQAAAKGLIGLGPGLTPSADDLLIGYLSALHWISKSFGKQAGLFREINKAIISSVESTNLLSAQMLKLAAHGEVNEVLVKLYQALLSGELDFGDLISNSMNFGSTSGVDTVVGIILGAAVALEVLA